MLSSARDVTDDVWVAKVVSEAMMHWHSSENRRVIQEVLVPGGDPKNFPESHHHGREDKSSIFDSPYLTQRAWLLDVHSSWVCLRLT
eukprot:1949660-Pleurochrysis_carterae.AAC.1